MSAPRGGPLAGLNEAIERVREGWSHRPSRHPLTWAERASDARPAQTGVVELDDEGSMVHYTAPGSIPHQLGLRPQVLHATKAHTEGSAATADARNWDSYGAANEPTDVKGDGTTHGNEFGV
jgi:hypothetical protein